MEIDLFAEKFIEFLLTNIRQPKPISDDPLSPPKLHYLSAQETAKSSKTSKCRGTGIGGLRPKFSLD